MRPRAIAGLVWVVSAAWGGAPAAATPTDGGSHHVDAAPAPSAAVAKSSEAPRLPWVNPARCHATCAFHPGASLARLNDRGQANPRGHLRLDAAVVEPLQGLLEGARAAGFRVRISSGFRSYAEQARLFRSMKEKGRAARPGHSEHQLGTAVDLRLPNSAALGWVADHASEHGFVLSYPPGKQRLTGYRPEPWHIRFVGSEIAGALRRSGADTLEEFFRGHPQLAVSGTCGDCPSAASRTVCGGVTEEGRCAGTVLTWCYAGALATVDCAAFGHSCGRAAGAAVPDCVPPAVGPDSKTTVKTVE